MICDPMSILAILGKADSATNAELAVIAEIHQAVEWAVKQHCLCDIEQNTFVDELYPRFNRRVAVSDEVAGSWDVVGDRAVRMTRSRNPANRFLYVRNIPLRSVTSIYEDTNAYAGEGSSDFAAATELTLGTQYMPAWDSGSNASDGFCRSGKLIRINQDWPARERTVKITYVGGWTAAELHTGRASPIRQAVILQMKHAFSQKGTAAGAKKSERLGDWSVEYVMEKARELTSEVTGKLKRFRNTYFRI